MTCSKGMNIFWTIQPGLLFGCMTHIWRPARILEPVHRTQWHGEGLRRRLVKIARFRTFVPVCWGLNQLAYTLMTMENMIVASADWGTAVGVVVTKGTNTASKIVPARGCTGHRKLFKGAKKWIVKSVHITSIELSASYVLKMSLEYQKVWRALRL